MSKPKLDEDEIGKAYGRFIITNLFKKNYRSYFSVVCDEGHTKNIRADALKKTCNVCYECDFSNPMYKTKTYNSWDSMVQRTTNEDSLSFHKYGAVGISCFEAWKLPKGEGWKNFYDFMGDCPEGMTLDRWPNKSGNYEPGNVRWATNSEQGYNQKLRSTNQSGKTGVRFNNSRDRWYAQITFNNKSIHLGTFFTFEEAVKAREEAELKYFGENKE